MRFIDDDAVEVLRAESLQAILTGKGLDGRENEIGLGVTLGADVESIGFAFPKHMPKRLHGLTGNALSVHHEKDPASLQVSNEKADKYVLPVPVAEITSALSSPSSTNS